MAGHPGKEYLDAAFGIQEQRRLRYVEEAKRTPGSWWFENERRTPSRQREAEAAEDTPEHAREAQEPSRDSPTTRSRRALSVTGECLCCGRAFMGRRSSARFCGAICRQRSRRGRCEEAA
jgi:hypothetical protein